MVRYIVQLLMGESASWAKLPSNWPVTNCYRAIRFGFKCQPTFVIWFVVCNLSGIMQLWFIWICVWHFIEPHENRVLLRYHSDSAMWTLTFSMSLCDIPSKKGIYEILVNSLKKNTKLFMLMPTLSWTKSEISFLIFLCIDSVANTPLTYCHLLRMANS
jgi:hypothetical protein